ncbi:CONSTITUTIVE EXPRESSER OF PR GENES 1, CONSTITUTIVE EXPRESSER OF PR GENES 30 [Hibiscus trionum]|uniref:CONSTITUTIVE EXPRESSER OF PR GENES 1, CONSTITUTIVE EXPRESSER OF PR GENES 30 n=1 Tax=Hibiscus trionum TaxID=183268 RepID=A0A9W7HB30_HIBTR|nr:CONSTITUTIVE EXPRESSER OF PR GENES 1, CONSTITUTIVE EXPRESSER OF PR GENES 30 [Hibiscus trionum]
MAILSHDVILDVLCRVGVKDLLRFRCVSKPWCSTIDGPDFIKRHLSHSLKTNTNLSLILRSSHTFSVDFDSLEASQRLKHPLEESDQWSCTQIFGSCNGLLALHNSDREELSLWNPSTTRTQMLPFTDMEFPPWSLGFQFIVYGFGYDPISDDYKLVRIVQFHGKDQDSNDYEVRVYSLRTDFWRRIKDFPFHLEYEYQSGVPANNALHWLASKKPDSDTHIFVAALDLETEEYRVIELPDSFAMGFYLSMTAMAGCLCLIADYHGYSDIWLMKEYGMKESWTKLVSVQQLKSGLPVLPVALSKTGDKLLLNIGSKFAWYDLISKMAENIRIGDVPHCSSAELLVQSLVPLNDNGEVRDRDMSGIIWYD